MDALFGWISIDPIFPATRALRSYPSNAPLQSSHAEGPSSSTGVVWTLPILKTPLCMTEYLVLDEEEQDYLETVARLREAAALCNSGQNSLDNDAGRVVTGSTASSNDVWDRGHGAGSHASRLSFDSFLGSPGGALSRPVGSHPVHIKPTDFL